MAVARVPQRATGLQRRRRRDRDIERAVRERRRPAQRDHRRLGPQGRRGPVICVHVFSNFVLGQNASLTAMGSTGIGGTTVAGIAGSVRDLVGMGRLRGGDALPPIRSLAQDLGVNRNTVAAAYRVLVAAGVAQTRGRAGTAITTVPDV